MIGYPSCVEGGVDLMARRASPLLCLLVEKFDTKHSGTRLPGCRWKVSDGLAMLKKEMAIDTVRSLVVLKVSRMSHLFEHSLSVLPRALVSRVVACLVFALSATR